MIPNKVILDDTHEGRQLRGEYHKGRQMIDLYYRTQWAMESDLYDSILDLWKLLLRDCISFKDFQLGIEKLLFDLESNPFSIFRHCLSEDIEKDMYFMRNAKAIKDYLINLAKKAAIANSEYLSILPTCKKTTCGKFIHWKHDGRVWKMRDGLPSTAHPLTHYSPNS